MWPPLLTAVWKMLRVEKKLTSHLPAAFLLRCIDFLASFIAARGSMMHRCTDKNALQIIFINAFNIENPNSAAIWISLKNFSIEREWKTAAKAANAAEQRANLLFHINYINVLSAQKITTHGRPVIFKLDCLLVMVIKHSRLAKKKCFI